MPQIHQIKKITIKNRLKILHEIAKKFHEIKIK